MPRLLIPTRNRPTSLGGVLAYLVRFYPKTEVIIADGSVEEMKPANRAQAVAAQGQGLSVDYRAFPYEMPFFERLLDVLKNESDPYFILGSDDDYPMMDVMLRGERFLMANDTYVTSLGAMVHLTLHSPVELEGRLSLARPIVGQTAAVRAMNYGRWMFSSMYAVTRREHMIERYERSNKLFLSGFYDFGVGVHDAMAGSTKAWPEIGFIATRNYTHSYLRPEADLIFLRRANEVLEMMDTMRRDLESLQDISAQDAQSVAEKLIRLQVIDRCGIQAHDKPGFAASPMFLHPMVQSQMAMFDGMFRAGTTARARYLDRLKYIVAAAQANALSGDNGGERRIYETLESQAANASNEVGEDWAGVRKGGITRAAGATRPKGTQDIMRMRRPIDPVTLLTIEGSAAAADNATADAAE